MFEKFGRSLDGLLGSVKNDLKMTRIEPKTDRIAIAYPTATPAKLRLEMNVGKLKITPGTDKLVDGTATYNVLEWTPEISLDGGNVTIKQGRGFNMVGSWTDTQNYWELALGTTLPFELSLQKGVGESTLALGGIPLTGAILNTGTGATTISFDQPNPEPAERLQVRTATGATHIDNMLNTNAQLISVESGAGEIALHFTGEALKRDTLVKANLGAGKVTINIKQGVPARVSINRGLGEIKALGAFSPAGQRAFETSGFAAAAGPKLTFEINAGLGSITLNAMDGLEDIFA